MKNKLIEVFGKEKMNHQGCFCSDLYIADYTERTNSKRAVEVHCIKPLDIDALSILNPAKIHITVSVFKPQCFMTEDGKEIKQCECVLYPTAYANENWITFVEIKDCKPKNVSDYHRDVKEKIITNIGLFRDKGVIKKNKIVYAVASFPRTSKTNYHNHLIKASEWKHFREVYKVMIKGTNEIIINNITSIS